MTSLQFKLLKSYFRLQRLFTRPGRKLDVSRERAELDSLGSMFKPLAPIESTKEVANGVPAEWLIPTGASSSRVVLYLHGGSYVVGSIGSHRSLAANIAHAARARALIIDYRLAPEHPFPAAIQDSVSAYRWLTKNHVAPDHITIAGDSAGGGLALALVLSLRDGNLSLPAAVVCLSPWTDLAATGESWKTRVNADLVIDTRMEAEFARMYLGDVDPRSPLASPLYSDLKGLPPLLIQVGTDEVLLSDSSRLADRARSAGVDVTYQEWEGMQHVWQFAASFIPEGRQAIATIGDFIQMYT